MNLGGAQPTERLQMVGRGISEVVEEPVALMNLIQIDHQPIARHLGDNRSRRDRSHEIIPLYDRLYSPIQGRQAVAINPDFFFSQSQPPSDRRHRFERCPKDIQPINRFDVDDLDRILAAADDALEALLAPGRGELLRIAQTRALESLFHPHCGDHQWTRKRSAARLVDANQTRRLSSS